jgi:hypothetical protein
MSSCSVFCHDRITGWSGRKSAQDVVKYYGNVDALQRRSRTFMACPAFQVGYHLERSVGAAWSPQDSEFRSQVLRFPGART